MYASGTTTPSEDDNANTHGTVSNSNNSNSEGLARRNTNPFASWMGPIDLDLDLDPFHDPSHSQQQYHHDEHRQQSTAAGSSSSSSELPHPLFPSFHISAPNSITIPPSSSSSSSLPTSHAYTTPPTPALTRDRTDLTQQYPHRRTFSPPSLHMPTAAMPAAGASSSSSLAFSNTSTHSPTLPYTPYQPPPIRPEGPTPTLSQQGSLALRDSRLLEPEPVSPSASTLVGSPMTPHDNGKRRFSWVGSNGGGGGDQSLSANSSAAGSPEDLTRSGGGNVASTYRLGAFGNKRKSLTHSKSDQDFSSSSSSVGPASAARTLGYHDHNSGGAAQYSHYHHLHGHNQQQSGHHPGWEPHVSVMMDEISLESFVPSDSPPKKNQHHIGLYNKGRHGGGDGRASPANEFGRSSNTSMVTLLAQTNTMTTNSSSTTLFGGFKSKSKSRNSFKKLNDSQDDILETSSQLQQQQHQTVTMSAEGKVYSKRPRDKKFGKKGGGGGKGGNGGDGGNSDRKALFSNERTLVQWIKFGILLGTMALTLCNFGRIGSFAFYIGTSMLVVAMTTLGYAATTFHLRDRSLSRRLKAAMARKKAKRDKKSGEGAVDPSLLNAKEICYYDRKGPTIICCILIFACSINFYLSLAYGSTMNKDGLSYFHVEY